MSFSPEIDIHEMYRKLSVLEEEEPQLQLVWQEETSEIHARVMGEVQIEILQSLIRERFGVEAFFLLVPLFTRKLWRILSKISSLCMLYVSTACYKCDLRIGQL